MTDTTATNRRLVEEMYRAATELDFEGMLSYVSDDIVLREPAFLPYGGVFHGKQEMASAIERIAAFLDVTKISIEYLVADGDRVFGVVRVPDQKSGDEVLLAEESIIHNGKVAEMRIFFHEARGLASPAA